jgi:hypothetical protein
MTTVGGSLGLELLPLGLEVPAVEPKRSDMLSECERLERFKGCWAVPCSPAMPAVLEGRGLLRASFSVEVDDVGVRTGD